MRKNLFSWIGRLMVILLLMSGVNFSRHFCMPEMPAGNRNLKVDCCGNNCEPESKGLSVKSESLASCCYLIESYLYFPVYSVHQVNSPAPEILQLAEHACITFKLILYVGAVSNQPEIALKGYPPDPEPSSISVFRI